MKIQIKNRFTDSVIIEGEYKSIKEALEKNSEVDLRETNLLGADLREANLLGVDLSWANLRGVDLSWANLRWTNLLGADLLGADLSGANLSGAKIKATQKDELLKAINIIIEE